jgi:hypothetical protein
MRCDHCQHWTPGGEPDSYRQYEGIGHCDKPIMLWDATEWVEREGDDGHDYYRVKTEAAGDTKMFVQDGSDYRANLFTASDFFCAHFVEKAA